MKVHIHFPIEVFLENSDLDGIGESPGAFVLFETQLYSVHKYKTS